MFSKKRIKLAFFTISASVILLLVARLLLPIGDEPDFYVQAGDFLNTDHGLLSPFHYFQPIFRSDPSLITQTTFSSVAYRLLLSIVITLPLYLYLIKASAEKPLAQNWGGRQNYIAMSLLCPSIWFHLGLLGDNALITALLLLYFCIERSLWKFLIFLTALYVDLGNTIVFIYFWLLYRTFLTTLKCWGLKITWSLMIGLALVSYLFSMNLLTMMAQIPLIGERASVIYEHYTYIYTDINDKYPLFLRPIITFMGLVFMLPESKIMIAPAYPFVAFFVFLMLARVSRLYKEHTRVVALVYAAITIVVTIPMILPGFSNVKYYVFILPAILNGFLLTFERKNVWLWIFVLNLLVLTRLTVESW